LREAFFQLCDVLDVKCVIPDQDFRNVTYGSQISRNHSAALNWAWSNVILPHHACSLVVIMDPDLFPLGPVSLVRRLRGSDPVTSESPMCHIRGLLGGNVPCVGRCAPDTYISFMLPWVIMFDMAALPAEKDSIRFDPIMYKGVQLDSGGALAVLFDKHHAFDMDGDMEPALRVCSVHSYKAVPDTTDFCLHQFPELPLPDFLDGVFLHAQSLGSDWDVEYIEMGWGKNTSGTPRQQLVDRSLTQMHRKAIKRKCVLDLVEDALVNPIKCVWDDYQKGPSARLPFPNPPQCIWSSL